MSTLKLDYLKLMECYRQLRAEKNNLFYQLSNINNGSYVSDIRTCSDYNVLKEKYVLIEQEYTELLGKSFDLMDEKQQLTNFVGNLNQRITDSDEIRMKYEKLLSEKILLIDENKKLSDDTIIVNNKCVELSGALQSANCEINTYEQEWINADKCKINIENKLIMMNIDYQQLKHDTNKCLDQNKNLNKIIVDNDLKYQSLLNEKKSVDEENMKLNKSVNDIGQKYENLYDYHNKLLCEKKVIDEENEILSLNNADINDKYLKLYEQHHTLINRCDNNMNRRDPENSMDSKKSTNSEFSDKYEKVRRDYQTLIHEYNLLFENNRNIRIEYNSLVQTLNLNDVIDFTSSIREQQDLILKSMNVEDKQSNVFKSLKSLGSDIKERLMTVFN